MPFYADDFAKLQNNDPSLNTFFLERYSGTDGDLKMVADALLHNDQLRKLLIFSHTKIGPQGIQYIIDALINSNNQALEELEFQNLGWQGDKNTGILDDGAIHIARLIQSNHFLKKLDVSSSRITGQGTKIILSSLIGNTSLQNFFCNGNIIDDEGVEYISQILANNNLLQELRVMNSKFSEENIQKIFLALEHNTTLKEIWLTSNDINDTHIEQLCSVIRNNSALNYLDIRYNKIKSNHAATLLADALQDNYTLLRLEIEEGNKILENDPAMKRIREYMVRNHRISSCVKYFQRIGLLTGNQAQANLNALATVDDPDHLLAVFQLLPISNLVVAQDNFNKLITHISVLFGSPEAEMYWGWVYGFTQEQFDALVNICEQNQDDPVHATQEIVNYFEALFHEDLEHENAEAHGVNTAQSTHTASVHRTVSESAERLLHHYGSQVTSLGLSNILKTITEWVDALPNEILINDAAKSCITRLTDQSYVYTEPVTQINTRFLLALTWLAIHDNEAREGKRG